MNNSIILCTGNGSSSNKPSQYISNNPHRVLKAVVDMMKERYANENYEPLTLDQLLTNIDRADVTSELKQWLVQALRNNDKVEYYPDRECFLFKPTLGLNVRTRRQLLQRLKVNDEEGLGGVLVSEIREAVHSPDRVIKVSTKTMVPITCMPMTIVFIVIDVELNVPSPHRSWILPVKYYV